MYRIVNFTIQPEPDIPYIPNIFKRNAIKSFYYHDCINNIHAVATECPYRLPSRHICLRHYQLNVLRVNSRLVNLDQNIKLWSPQSKLSITAAVNISNQDTTAV